MYSEPEKDTISEGTDNFEKPEKTKNFKFSIEKVTRFSNSQAQPTYQVLLCQKKKREDDNCIAQRRSKHDLEGRNYLCSICYKSYLSYAAMYVHLKRRHGIPVKELKNSYVKRSKASSLVVLSNIREQQSYPEFNSTFENIFKKSFSEIYVGNYGKYSDFYLPRSGGYQAHPLYSEFLQVRNLFESKALLEKLTNKEFFTSMDRALATFLFSYWGSSEISENLMNMKITFLFREYLNLVGWEMINHLLEYRIVEFPVEVVGKKEYTRCMMAENLVEFINDFMGYFLSKRLKVEERCECKRFLNEFCNLLFTEKIISYIIEPSEV